MKFPRALFPQLFLSRNNPALFLLLILGITFQLNGQEIGGRILDSLTNNPLEYASVGIIDTRLGTITDQEGMFSLEVPDLESGSKIRISMIGYKAQTFTLGELLKGELSIRLVVDPIPLSEVTITPLAEPYSVGTTRYARLGNWCGWGGSRFGEGHEIGSRLNLGDTPAHIKKLHVHMQRQSYDTSWYRLHIRSLKEEIPDRELLTSNVIVAIDKEKGWVDLDLAEYHIVLEGEVAVTLEWLKVSGINEDRSMKINKKVTSEYVLINTGKNDGCIYTKWGVEGNWNTGNEGSPAFYLTVQK